MSVRALAIAVKLMKAQLDALVKDASQMQGEAD
jgi:hypothetical protein